jgi:hypothetical protein
MIQVRRFIGIIIYNPSNAKKPHPSKSEMPPKLKDVKLRSYPLQNLNFEKHITATPNTCSQFIILSRGCLLFAVSHSYNILSAWSEFINIDKKN